MPTPTVHPEEEEEGVLLTIMATRTTDMATVTVMVIHMVNMDMPTTMVILMDQVEEE